ncbi:hypothetical protein AU476_29935 [Cupriavidus sp. UYMSc13B]|nr:hypothetical protein AU476_29935 [Cupriavidus sp. UYMSc13B]
MADGILAPRIADGVGYLTGGVGQDEAACVCKASGNYSLRLTFTESGGQYLAGVDTHVYDSRGNLRLAAVSEGPLLSVQLPPAATAAALKRDIGQHTKVTGSFVARPRARFRRSRPRCRRFIK